MNDLARYELAPYILQTYGANWRNMVVWEPPPAAIGTGDGAAPNCEHPGVKDVTGARFDALDWEIFRGVDKRKVKGQFIVCLPPNLSKPLLACLSLIPSVCLLRRVRTSVPLYLFLFLCLPACLFVLFAILCDRSIVSGHGPCPYYFFYQRGHGPQGNAGNRRLKQSSGYRSHYEVARAIKLWAGGDWKTKVQCKKAR